MNTMKIVRLHNKAVLAVILIVIISLKLIHNHIQTRPKFHCNNRDNRERHYQRGEDFYVLENYIRADKQFGCAESVTFTTHGDHRFLDNLVNIVNRWQGPVSVALYVPGTDFMPAVESIAYYRHCLPEVSADIRKFVSFSLYIHNAHMPAQKITSEQAIAIKPNCKVNPMQKWSQQSYRSLSNLEYPINTGRNIAIEAATTHWILPADMELYPNPGLIQDFLDMVLKDDNENNNPRVYVLVPFEIQEGQTLPDTKPEVQKMMKDGTVFAFEERRQCRQCHHVPNWDEWKSAEPKNGLSVFARAKRNWTDFKSWEPFYICTKNDPLFDERLTWEASSDKMALAFKLCLLNYDFLLLDNAFLIHKPGFKPIKDGPEFKEAIEAVRKSVKYKQYVKTKDYIELEYRDLYGKGSLNGCFMDKFGRVIQ